MDAKRSLFYGFGEVAYALGMSDGKINEKEKTVFHNTIRREMNECDPDFDYADVVFDLMKKEEVDLQTAYKWGLNAMNLGKHYLTPFLRKEFVSILEALAKTNPPVSQEEREIINKFRDDISHI